MRDGFTTGTCAAAAAKAAAAILCHGQTAGSAVELMVPAGILVTMPVEVLNKEKDSVFVRVRKDAGDDPDVTNGTWIQAKVSLVSERHFQYLHKNGHGYWLEDYPRCYLTGGTGVGIVTKAGLSCPVGAYAINPVPRTMIIAAVSEQLMSGRDDGDVLFAGIEISVPAGEELGKKTFNPKLGIVGGISIIGTTGIVKPMSEKALLDTIRLELHMKAVQQSPVVFLTPGNYGRSFLKERLGIPLDEAVTCSNFVADAAGMAAAEGINRLLFAGHIGKLIKVSGGIPNTHSQYGDRRMELLGNHTEPYDEALAALIVSANTTEEAVGMLAERGLAEAVLTDTAGLVKQHLEHWGEGRFEAEVITFSSAYGVLGMTEQAVAWIAEWKHEQDRKTEVTEG